MSWCSPRAWDREPTPSLWPRPPQVHAGKDVLNSELVLPSGMGLSLGAMIHVMRRRKVMDGIFEVGETGKGREGKGGAMIHTMIYARRKVMTASSRCGAGGGEAGEGEGKGEGSKEPQAARCNRGRGLTKR